MRTSHILAVSRLFPAIVLNIGCLTLAGCAGDVPFGPSELVPPAKRCMASPVALAKLKEGDDLIQAYAAVARSYGREASKLRCVQRWSRTVLNKGE